MEDGERRRGIRDLFDVLTMILFPEEARNKQSPLSVGRQRFIPLLVCRVKAVRGNWTLILSILP